MRLQTWAIGLLLAALLYGGRSASAQYSEPATPAPYNPIALAEVTGAARTAVQAGQNNIRPCHRTPTSEGFLRAQSAQLQSDSPSTTRSLSGLSKILAESWPRMLLPTHGDSAGKR
jgi:hypothetical protein